MEETGFRARDAQVGVHHGTAGSRFHEMRHGAEPRPHAWSCAQRSTRNRATTRTGLCSGPLMFRRDRVDADAARQALWIGVVRTAIGIGVLLSPGRLLRSWGFPDQESRSGSV